MDGFTYTNIFETKGIEYLAIIAFFAILIPFWIILSKQVKLSKEIKTKLGNLSSIMLNMPQGLFFSSNHTWTHLERSGLAKIGLDNMLLRLTGNVNIHFIKKPGEELQKGELLAEIDHMGKRLKVLSPISGKIISSNSFIIDNPDLLNNDPYGKGWIFKIKPNQWIEDTNSYYLADKAVNWSHTELERFKDFIAASVAKHSVNQAGIILQDGGELRNEPLSLMPVEVWNDFQQNFMEIE